ncbi:MAG: Asp-tRNA(Asn)/Glu-tRNA(Gln) amidotransferase subunit GatC [Candidatus Caldatribacteriota bacterium]|nr:Asp-tRNA(Asn)/Glu-tRNA(Gln) amidotransferase subunit GatC [Candidatus Caldatribacteriota bacterium]
MTDKIITKKEVEYVAQLANLEFDKKEKEEYTAQLNSILDYFKKINELNTKNILPTAYITDMPNLINEDKVESSFPQKTVISMSNNTKRGYFKVPKIM